MKLPLKSDKNKFSFFIIDDSMSITKTLKEMIESFEGKYIGNASNSTEAFSQLVKYINEIDFILLDILMPDISGLKIIPAIKTINPNFKIIMLSALSSPANIQQAISLGASHFIAKPFRVDQFFNVIKTLCESSIKDSNTSIHETKKDFTKIHALIIEDSNLSANFIRTKLESLGCKVVGIAHRGQQALDILNKVPSINLAVLSMVLPDMDGLSLIIKINMFDPDIKIIMFSAKDDARSIEKTKELGVDYYISKSNFTDRQLYEALYELFTDL
ncbi:MAG: response regulator [Candidatus Margulisbacteria bacterium]|nr:response regulator [Candidatus Margulisiibacteriota bacterium]